jgi:hypothetical protein
LEPLASGSTPTPTSTSDVALPTHSQPPPLPQVHPFRQDHRPHRQALQPARNAHPARHLPPAGTRTSSPTQTPEDRLLHLDKHLRRNVLFEHIARETYPAAHPASTPTTGSSRPAGENDSHASTSQRQASSSLTTSATRQRRRPTTSTSSCRRSGPRTSSRTTTRT